ncbi:MAG: ectoine/hydroxyectoine ABC transporter permease subunit EhuC [Trueperaceae bacterium]|jgi:polar amino acid transport system permease protein|nr:ectoine/hydroxyectoine ABC transporter permease subunit EhuC [Truepera sp.]HRQ09910.1 ectoine/hydroxyectoine ABC transporter permease subunit EhuC [Trueperaceae bacterium]
MQDLQELLAPLLRGTVVTVQLALISTVFGAILSFAAGIGKLSRNWLVRGIAVIYIEVFRGTSLLVQMFWLFFALPLIGISLPPYVAGIVALSLNIGAYGAEVVRGAIKTVPIGQYEAAKALNFSSRYTLWNVALPQALVEMMPPFGNLVVQNLKDTALVSLITLTDLTFAAQTIRNLTHESIPAFTATLIIYFVLAMVFIGGMRLLERFIARRVGVTQARTRG